MLDRAGYKSPMLRQGPIPRFAHGLLEYLAAILLFVAPIALSFDSSAATAASIVAGVVVLVVAASSAGPTSLVDQIPLAAHYVLDWVFALALIAVPFVAGFSDETEPTAFFLALGVVHVLVTIGTRYQPRAREARGR
jgi:hypothetical protein